MVYGMDRAKFPLLFTDFKLSISLVCITSYSVSRLLFYSFLLNLTILEQIYFNFLASEPLLDFLFSFSECI